MSGLKQCLRGRAAHADKTVGDARFRKIYMAVDSKSTVDLKLLDKILKSTSSVSANDLIPILQKIQNYYISILFYLKPLFA